MRQRPRFSQSAIEGLGYYVYYLQDPRDGSIFYVGKGHGNRVFEHAFADLDKYSDSEKIDVIRDIHAAGMDVHNVILRHGMSEDQAYEVESAVIDFIGLQNLTNKVAGHYAFNRGVMTAKEIEQLYSSEEAEIVDPVLIITINRLYAREMSPEDLYEATRASWKVGQRRNKVSYVLSTFRGIVREVYVVDTWEQVVVENGSKRWKFNGDKADDVVRRRYLNKTVRNYIGTRGTQNPLRYVHC